MAATININIGTGIGSGASLRITRIGLLIGRGEVTLEVLVDARRAALPARAGVSPGQRCGSGASGGVPPRVSPATGTVDPQSRLRQRLPPVLSEPGASGVVSCSGLLSVVTSHVADDVGELVGARQRWAHLLQQSPMSVYVLTASGVSNT